MGLDISAQSHIELAGLADEYDEELEDTSIEQEYINPAFPHAVPSVNRQYMRYRLTDRTETHSFRAGSYGGYGTFRALLAEASLGEKSIRSNNPFWENIEKYKGKPFYDLINFSDCEGIMVGPVCERLRADFVTHQDGFISFLVNSGLDSRVVRMYVETYEDWTRAFELASQNGVVIFH